MEYRRIRMSLQQQYLDDGWRAVAGDPLQWGNGTELAVLVEREVSIPRIDSSHRWQLFKRVWAWLMLRVRTWL